MQPIRPEDSRDEEFLETEVIGIVDEFDELSPPVMPTTNEELSDAEEFRKFIEVEVLTVIKELAEAGNTTEERIQEIARRTLDLVLPDMSVQDLYAGALQVCAEFRELLPKLPLIVKEFKTKYSLPKTQEN